MRDSTRRRRTQSTRTRRPLGNFEATGESNMQLAAAFAAERHRCFRPCTNATSRSAPSVPDRRDGDVRSDSHPPFVWPRYAAAGPCGERLPASRWSAEETSLPCVAQVSVDPHAPRCRNCGEREVSPACGEAHPVSGAVWVGQGNDRAYCRQHEATCPRLYGPLQQTVARELNVADNSLANDRREWSF